MTELMETKCISIAQIISAAMNLTIAAQKELNQKDSIDSDLLRGIESLFLSHLSVPKDGMPSIRLDHDNAENLLKLVVSRWIIVQKFVSKGSADDSILKTGRSEKMLRHGPDGLGRDQPHSKGRQEPPRVHAHTIAAATRLRLNATGAGLANILPGAGAHQPAARAPRAAVRRAGGSTSVPARGGSPAARRGGQLCARPGLPGVRLPSAHRAA